MVAYRVVNKEEKNPTCNPPLNSVPNPEVQILWRNALCTQIISLKNKDPYVQAPGTVLKNTTQLATLTHEY